MRSQPFSLTVLADNLLLAEVRYNPLLEAHLLSLLEKADLRGKTGECASKANLQHPS